MTKDFNTSNLFSDTSIAFKSKGKKPPKHGYQFLKTLQTQEKRFSVNDVLRHFQRYFSYIVAVSFIGGGNRSTRRKSQTYHIPLTNLITQCCIEYTSPERDSYCQR